MIIREVKPFGKNGGHIVIPREYVGKEVQVIVPTEDEENRVLKKREIESLINAKLVKLDISEDIEAKLNDLIQRGVIRR